ncbi:MAG: hypothetical protein PHY45_12645 [Rhodocyclaceae bacterium]|nr:hypothetical protein [Rhodocyclaceae bacterium]
MIQLPRSLAAWPSPQFQAVLKEELEQSDAGEFPLQEGLSSSSYALPGAFSVMVIGAGDDDVFIRVRVGIFYSGLIAGCSCADDPTPVEPLAEYCEVEVTIDKATAAAVVKLS